MSLLFLFNLKLVWLEESYRKYRDLKESAVREKKGKHIQVCCYIFCTIECTCLSMYNCVQYVLFLSIIMQRKQHLVAYVFNTPALLLAFQQYVRTCITQLVS